MLILPLIQKSLASQESNTGQFPVSLSLFVQPYFDKCQSGSSTASEIIDLEVVCKPSTPSNQASRIFSKINFKLHLSRYLHLTYKSHSLEK